MQLLTVHIDAASAVRTPRILAWTESNSEIAVLNGMATGTDATIGQVVGSY